MTYKPTVTLLAAFVGQGLALAKAPLYFEENRGQAHPDVRYLARGARHTLFLTGDRAVLRGDDGSRLTLTVKRSRAGAQPEAEQPQPGRSNYFRGNDPAKWVRDVPHYARVRYARVYEGIDLLFHSDGQRQLEYDFLVQPGADPRRIAVDFGGVRKASLEPNGDLLLETETGVLHQPKPVIYQRDGVHRRTVEGAFELRDASEIGFRIGEYDKTRELVIDPVLVYSTYLGSPLSDFAGGVAVRNSETWVTGSTSSTKLAFEGGVSTLLPFPDIYVTRLNASGALVYHTILGGSGVDGTGAIAVNSNNEVYVTGWTSSTDFPNHQSGSNLNGAQSGFLIRLNALGNAVTYSSTWGGALNGSNQWFAPHKIALDSSGLPHITGATGPYGTVGQTAFYARLKSVGRNLLLQQIALSPNVPTCVVADARSIAIDALGRPWIAGDSQCTGLSGAVNNPPGNGDVFLTRIKINGNSPQVDLTRYVGSPATREARGHLGSNSTAMYLAFTTDPGGLAQLRLSKLNFDGVAVGTNAGLGLAANGFSGISVTNDRVYTVGSATSVALLNPPAAPLDPESNAGAFLIASKATDLTPIYSTTIKGLTDVVLPIRAVAAENSGRVAIVGSTDSLTLPVQAAIQSTNAGGIDGWVISINP